MKQSLNDEEVFKQIRKIQEDYDNTLDFYQYALRVLKDRAIPDVEMDFKICCPLHEERTPSFSYSSKRKIWKCFGECATGGKVVKFHKLYMEKKLGKKVSYMSAMKDLHRLFPELLYPPIIKKTYKQQTTTLEDDLAQLGAIVGILENEEASTREIKLKKEYSDINQFVLHCFLKSDREREEANKK